MNDLSVPRNQEIKALIYDCLLFCEVIWKN